MRKSSYSQLPPTDAPPFSIDDDDDDNDFTVLNPAASLAPSSSLQTLYETLTFKFIHPLLKLGNTHDSLSPSDLPPLPSHSLSATITAQFTHAFTTTPRTPSPYHPLQSHLSRSLFSAFSGPFMRAGYLKLVHDLCVFIGPQVLKALIKFINTPDAPLSTGLYLTALVTLSQLTMSLCLRQYFFACYCTGLRLRSSVVTAVFNKSLTLSSQARLSKTTGEITNLMSTDAQRLQVSGGEGGEREWGNSWATARVKNKLSRTR